MMSLANYYSPLRSHIELANIVIIRYIRTQPPPCEVDSMNLGEEKPPLWRFFYLWGPCSEITNKNNSLRRWVQPVFREFKGDGVPVARPFSLGQAPVPRTKP